MNRHLGMGALALSQTNQEKEVKNMKFFSRLFMALVVLPLALTSLTANASLVGSTVHSTLFTEAAGSWNYASSPSSAVVGSGVEFFSSYNSNLCGTPTECMGISLDIGPTSFTLRFYNYWQGASYNPQGEFNLGLLGFNLTGLNDPAGTITDISLASSTFPSDVFSNTNFTANSFTWNRDPTYLAIPGNGTNWSATWNITTSVPEPASLALLGLGLAGLGFSRRKKA